MTHQTKISLFKVFILLPPPLATISTFSGWPNYINLICVVIVAISGLWSIKYEEEVAKKQEENIQEIKNKIDKLPETTNQKDTFDLKRRIAEDCAKARALRQRRGMGQIKS